ncbi:hypothetical protein WR25_16381 [Diploscapter pachys]|uniref:Neurotransmitter-gated ion-channel ligand-binding domain-containing protein n=1 Tax=Diploscapter pachys TaxID=2018661 RepID=A0A2A2KUQ0_9BILA|nr:hypothetical protein WR25_16381 [Diploscapter pachys]
MSRHAPLIVVLLLLLSIPECSSQGGKLQQTRRIASETQILNRLLSDYDPFTRPPVRDSARHSAIVVIAQVFINSIQWKETTAILDLFLRQEWEDNRLEYDVDPREDIDEIRLPVNKKIWFPDTYFSTGNENREQRGHSFVVVEPSGHVRASESRHIEVPYTNDASPFSNSRVVTLRLASYRYPLEDVVYMWASSPPLVNPVEVSSSLMTAAYSFEEAQEGDCVGNYTVGMYSCIDVTVKFSSSTLSSLSQWFFPSVLLVIASWFHFWIHGSWSVPRTVSAAVPFFFFVLLFIFKPQLVQQSCAMNTWLAFCLFMTFLSFLEYFLVICCGIRRSLRYSHVGHPEEHPIGSPKETTEVTYDSRCGTASNKLDLVSRVLFPVLFIIFLVIYFIFLI